MLKVTLKNGAKFITEEPMTELKKMQSFWDKRNAAGRKSRNPRPEIDKVEIFNGSL